MFIYWKGHISQGSKCDVPVSSIDILPTICRITGSEIPSGDIDGRDLSPAFKGSALKSVPLYWHFPHYRGDDVVPYTVIRDGDWKLIKRYEGKQFELFNLRDDPREEKDLSDEKAGKVKDLNRSVEAWIKATGARVPVAKKL
jgi:arylsulfatase A-like enzyme